MKPGTSHTDLFELVLAIANHSLGLPRSDPRKRKPTVVKLTDDEEIAEITKWIEKRCLFRLRDAELCWP